MENFYGQLYASHASRPDHGNEEVLKSDHEPPCAKTRQIPTTIDHIHTVRQIIQKTEEYNQPLCVAIVDYEKAFDSVEIWCFTRCHAPRSPRPALV
ncbi:hypothetical protein B5X24_HaOG213460 [Helicoverpa armigera]|nr:hypothetical protein B5X24_HaOG213460 [Helicoverpa armigera]